MSKDKFYDDYTVVEISMTYLFRTKNNLALNYISILIYLCTIFTLFPIVLLIGYTQDIRSSVYNRELEAPDFEDYERLLLEGGRTLVCYLPILFLMTVSIFLAIRVSIMLIGILGLSLYILPIISHKYSIIREYKDVYPSGITDIMTSDLYVKYFGLYVLTYTVFFVALITLGSLTFGVGFILLLPIFIVFRAVYWGYAFRDIESQLDNE